MSFYQPGFKDMFIHEPTRIKLLLGIFFSFAFFYNRRSVQIELDPWTDEYLRGTLMNSSSAVATLTVIILFNRYKLKNFRFVTILTPFIILAQLVVILLDYKNELF